VKSRVDSFGGGDGSNFYGTVCKEGSLPPNLASPSRGIITKGLFPPCPTDTQKKKRDGIIEASKNPSRWIVVRKLVFEAQSGKMTKPKRESIRMEEI